jgi:hypothetical protein
VTNGLSQRAPAGSDYLTLAAMLVVPFCCKRSYPRSRGNPHPHGWQVSRHPFNLSLRSALVRSLMRRASPWRNRRITVGRHIRQEPVHRLQPI